MTQGDAAAEFLRENGDALATLETKTV